MGSGKSLLLGGGHADPNLNVLAQAAQALDVEVLDARVAQDGGPGFTWNLDAGTAVIDGRVLQPTCAFVRHDVFTPGQGDRQMGWYQAVAGFVQANPEIRVFNRNMSLVAQNKPAALCAARSVGLAIPSTIVTNEKAQLLADPDGAIAKPVAGGGYCLSLRDAIERAEVRQERLAMPALVQKRLAAPEVRVYVIGQETFAFEMRTESLDYRVKQDVELILREPPEEASALRCLMKKLQMDFGAADFKTDPETGRLTFLELNTSPMFARFDYDSQGQLCRAMVRALTESD